MTPDGLSTTALRVVAGGFGIAMVFGYFAARANFCTMGAISDVVNLDDYRRLRSWILAAATAIIGTQALALTLMWPLGHAGRDPLR